MNKIPESPTNYKALIDYETLLQLDGGDFEVYRSVENGIEKYHILIEGYIGFSSLESFIDLYSEFLEEFKEFLESEGYVKPDQSSNAWKTFYRQREMDIRLTDDSIYWIFLEGYKSSEIWELYDYMEDVIKQLKELVNKNKLRRTN